MRPTKPVKTVYKSSSLFLQMPIVKYSLYLAFLLKTIGVSPARFFLFNVLTSSLPVISIQLSLPIILSKLILFYAYIKIREIKPASFLFFVILISLIINYYYYYYYLNTNIFFFLLFLYGVSIEFFNLV